MQVGRKLKALSIVTLLLCLSFLIPPASADQYEIYDFYQIWFKDGNFYKHNPGGGTLIMAVSYTNITPENLAWREIDHCIIDYDFSDGNFYLSITFEDELIIYRDSEGNIIWQEPSDGYIFLSKSAVDARLGDKIRQFASRHINFSTITFQGTQYYRVYVPNFNREYAWGKFTEPDDDKWYTWGSEDSILFYTKAMFIKEKYQTEGHIEFDISHMTDNSGQKVAINKTYLASKGITTPLFEWGEKKAYKLLGYDENETHYIIHPEHFSTIGIHEAASGYVDTKTDPYYTHGGEYPWFYLESGSGGAPNFNTRINCSYLYQPWSGGITNTLAVNTPMIDAWCDSYKSWDYWSKWEELISGGSSALGVAYINQYGWGTTTDTSMRMTFTGDDNAEKNFYGQRLVNVTGVNEITIDVKWYTPSSACTVSGMHFYVNGTELDACGGTYEGTDTLHLDVSNLTGMHYIKYRIYVISTYVPGTAYFCMDTFYFNGWNYIETPLNCTAEKLITDKSAYTTTMHNMTYDTYDCTYDYPGGLYEQEVDYPIQWYMKNSTGIKYNISESQIYTNCVMTDDYKLKINESMRGAEITTGVNFTSTTNYSYNIRAFRWRPWIGEYWTNAVQRIAGAFTERDIFEAVSTADLLGDPLMIEVPVSSSVMGITEIYAPDTLSSYNGGYAESVNSKLLVTPGKFYYNPSSQTVYVGIDNTSANRDIWISVNCTYGGTFAITPPTYLKSGDLFACTGVILDTDGDTINGILTYTNITSNTTEEVVVSSMWNCSNGNYQTMIATTSIVPGIYYWTIEFYDATSGITLIEGGPIYLDVPIGGGGEGPYYSANLYYTFFNLGTGTELTDDYLKMYIGPDTDFNEGDRVMGGEYPTYIGQTLYFKILDYFNNKIYPTDAEYSSVFVNYSETYIDIGLNLNQFRVKNMNTSTIYFIVKRGTQQIGRWIPPYEEQEYSLFDNFYNLSIFYFNSANGTLESTLYIYDYNISIDTFYYITGRNLEDIYTEVEGIGTWLYYTIFDMNTGSQLGDDFYKVYFSLDTNINENDRVKGGSLNVSIGTTYYYRITDYWNNTVYPTDGSEYDTLTIALQKTFLDIGIPLNQYLVKNMNMSLIYFRMTNGNWTNNTWYNRWIPPGESTELFIRSGTYNISIEYYYPHNGTFIRFQNLSNQSISTDSFYVIQGYNAKIYFNLYNTVNGIGLPSEALNVYINGIRLPEKQLDTFLGQNLSVIVKDYYDYELYNQSFVVSNPLTFYDLGLPFYSYKFCNRNDTYFIAGMKRDGSSTWWEKIVTPYETVEFIPPMGNYSIRVYNLSLTFAEFSDYVNSSKAFIIHGSNISLILEGQQTLVSQLESSLDEYNYTNSMVYTILGGMNYTNVTMQSILDTLREPHTWRIPSIEYTLEDTLAPISAISASLALGGGINVRWASTDDSTSTVLYTTIYYRKGSASWRIWKATAGASGEDTFDSSDVGESLENGTVYWFKCIGVDSSANVENETDANVCNITYSVWELPSSAFSSAEELISGAFTNIYFWAVIIVLVIILAVMVIKKRNNMKRTAYELYKSNQPFSYEEEF